MTIIDQNFRNSRFFLKNRPFREIKKVNSIDFDKKVFRKYLGISR